MRLICALILSAAGLLPVLAQNPAAAVTAEPTTNAPRRDTVHQVDSSQMYHRVYAHVPLVGSGRPGDEIRPMFAPATAQVSPVPAQTSKNHSGILAWQMLICDDGKTALVEFVGATPKDLQSITTSADSNVKIFERGKSSQAEIEAEFQKYKKDFTLNAFGARVQ